MKHFSFLIVFFIVNELNAIPTKNETATNEMITIRYDNDEHKTTTIHIENKNIKAVKNNDLIVEDGMFLKKISVNDDVDQDKTKKRIERETQPMRPKRAMIFRPLFVYNQQEIKRQRPTRKTTKRPIPWLVG